jgi:hypothetical protein
MHNNGWKYSKLYKRNKIKYSLYGSFQHEHKKVDSTF